MSAPDARAGSVWRRRARVLATALLAAVALEMLYSATTVRDRALAANLDEMAAVPGVETASYLSAGSCAVVLIGIGMRRFGPRRPGLRLLWLAGGATIGFAYLVAMWTASLWI